MRANQNNNHRNLTFMAHYSPRTHQLVFVLTQQRSSHIVDTASFALELLKSGFLRFGTWGRSSNTTQQNPVLLGVLLVSLVTKYPNPHTRQQGVGKGPSFLKIHQSVCLGQRYTKVYLLRIPKEHSSRARNYEDLLDRHKGTFL